MSQEAKETKKQEFTQAQAVRAHGALEKLYNQDIPSTEAFDVYMMMQKLEPIATFQQDQRRKIIADMKPKIENKGRTFNFGTTERLKEYQERIRKLEEMPADIDIKPIEVRLTPSLYIAGADIAALKGFINFVK